MNYTRVYYQARGVASNVQSGDLVFARGRPLLVLSWRRANGRRVPDRCVELDPRLLKRTSSNGTVYRYEGSIE